MIGHRGTCHLRGRVQNRRTNNYLAAGLARRVRALALPIVLLGTSALAIAQTGQPAGDAQELVTKVMKASGADNWGNVKEIKFTFNVTGADGKQLISAKHDWDLEKNTDTVEWGDKKVTVDLSKPATEGDDKAGFQRWTNDSYWLLMPLKLKDGGCTVTSPEANVLHLSFAGVGLTPGDQYNVYINPTSNLPEKWDYMPTPEKKVTGTWEDYKTTGGLTLATKHQFGDKTITFTDLDVVTK